MSWAESWHLMLGLAADPSSAVSAALAGWKHPVSPEWQLLANTYDLMHQIAWKQGGGKGSAPEAYPRPWPDPKKQERRRGDAAGRSPSEVRALLDQARRGQFSD